MIFSSLRLNSLILGKEGPTCGARPADKTEQVATARKSQADYLVQRNEGLLLMALAANYGAIEFKEVAPTTND